MDLFSDRSPLSTDTMGVFSDIENDPLFLELLSDLRNEYDDDDTLVFVDVPREEVQEVRLVVECPQVTVVVERPVSQQVTVVLESPVQEGEVEVDEEAIKAAIKANTKRIAKLKRKNARLTRKLTGVVKRQYTPKPFVPAKCLYCQGKRHTTTKCDFRGVGKACGFCEEHGFECHEAAVDYRRV